MMRLKQGRLLHSWIKGEFWETMFQLSIWLHGVTVYLFCIFGDNIVSCSTYECLLLRELSWSTICNGCESWHCDVEW